ncbi:hypothetical protein Pelo_12093 [Pelomyxa schiedti]|nr:hypothetical protein Pelo_12093 [Pelomyxa schiedti]
MWVRAGASNEAASRECLDRVASETHQLLANDTHFVTALNIALTTDNYLVVQMNWIPGGNLSTSIPSSPGACMCKLAEVQSVDVWRTSQLPTEACLIVHAKLGRGHGNVTVSPPRLPF